ncbi:MAG: tetratricopeptide repeat protein [Kiritimatiellae bacterium]|nr:tetratricopeptide repeat protein [Kiritimatiellia bacterium]
MNEQDSTMHKDGERRRRLTVWALAAGSLGLFLATLSRGAFPGLPARHLAWHLGLDAAPTLLDSLWGRLVRLCALLPGESLAFRVGALSAVFAALCVALTTALVMRIRYPVHDPHDPAETGREGQARWLAGVTAGLGMMVCIPFWVVATRSLPDAFHLCMLLGAAFLLSEYQRTGRNGFLYGLGLLYGVGVTEFPTFWVLAPFAAVLVARAMLQRAAFSWRVVLRMGLWAVPGLLMYVWNGWTLWSDAAIRLRGFGSLWSVIWFIWRDQWHQIVHAPQTTGFLMVLVLTLVPWGVMFLMRPKKPAWRYSAWQVFLRLVVLAASLGALFNAPLSGWRIFGMHYLMVTPYLILAACAGVVAGEFWVMGQGREHRNAGIGQPLRRLMGVLALLIPFSALAAGWLNRPVADGRPGGEVEAMAGELLDALKGRDVLLTDGVLDDSVRVLARGRGLDLTVIGVPQMASKLHRDHLAERFTHPRQQALLQVGFSAFVQDFLSDDAQLRRTAAVELAGPLREFGYLVPDRLVYRVAPNEAETDLPSLVASQQAFWRRLEAWGGVPLDERNPAWGYRQYLLRIASKVANNLGFAMIERGDAAGAEDLFRQARRLFPDNVSALLNLLTLAQAANSPEREAYEAEWEAFKERQMDSRVMWSLSSLYGYVHNTGYLVRHGMMWAVSGKPQMAEAEMRRASGGRAMDPRVKAFLARAYLQEGDLERSTEYYREALDENPADMGSLLMMVQLAIHAEDFPEAERLLTRAEEAGVPAEQLRFERAVLAYLQGHPDDALAALKTLVAQQRDDVRAWALLALLTADGRDPAVYEQSLKALQELRGASPDVRLMLAELYLSREEWALARAELDQVTRMNPRLIRAWEMLVQVDFRERKQELAEDHVRILLTLDPANYTGNLMLGSFQYARAQYALAESSYRAALAVRRDPTVLNDLAYLLMVRGDAPEEARTLIEEALVLQPDNPVLLSTRGELNLREGRLDQAEADLQRVMAAMPDHPQALLLTAQLYAARNQTDAAREMAQALADRQGELPAEQQAALKKLIEQLP